MELKIRLLEVIWGVIKLELEKLAKRTETKIDDVAIELVDKLIHELKTITQQKKQVRRDKLWQR